MARTFYIGTTGSDANPGTADQPFASAAAANALVQPGDTVYFLAGTYRNPTYGAVDAGGNRVIWKEAGDTILKLDNVQGTAGAPITYAAAPGAAVKLQYDGDSAIVLRGSSHIRIEGFEIEGPAASLTLEEARAAQWSYRVETGTDVSGNPVYDYRERDPAATLTTSVTSRRRREAGAVQRRRDLATERLAPHRDRRQQHSPLRGARHLRSWRQRLHHGLRQHDLGLHAAHLERHARHFLQGSRQPRYQRRRQDPRRRQYALRQLQPPGLLGGAEDTARHHGDRRGQTDPRTELVVDGRP